MSIKKYETLLKTIDLGSLTKASEELGYTQSAISHMITGLEDEMELKLLIRDRSGVRLTEEGRRLIPAIRKVCKANDEVFRQVAEIHGLEVGTIRIGAILSVSAHLLPDMIAQFSEKHPGIKFDLLHGSHTEIERWILEERIDCGFLWLPTAQQLERIIVMTEHLVAIFPKTRTLDNSLFPIENIVNENLILGMDSMECDQKSKLTDLLAKAKITYSAKDDHAVMAMVERGLGMSILPELLLKRTQYQVQRQELDPPLKREICLAYKDAQRLHPGARQFVQYIRKQYFDIV